MLCLYNVSVDSVSRSLHQMLVDDCGQFEFGPITRGSPNQHQLNSFSLYILSNRIRVIIKLNYLNDLIKQTDKEIIIIPRAILFDLGRKRCL